MKVLMKSFKFGLFALLALNSAPVFAQEAGADKMERVEVTGSHIKRVDVEGVAPVETVTKKDLEKKGYDNLGDVVKDLGVNTFGSNTVSGNSSTPGNADINLRGLGSDNTLVLLNGQRLPQDAITGTVDINMIPMAAVERIEILKDGASAIYGSDALGGVVNIITVKDFQGTQVNLTQSTSTNMSGGKMSNISVVNGINNDKLNVVTTLNYRYNQEVFSRDRFWLANSNSIYGIPGSYLDSSNVRHASDFCAPSDIVPIGTSGGSYCKFHYPNYSEESPLISQVSGMSEIHYEASSNVRLYGRLSYTHRYTQTIAAPAPGFFDIPAADVAGSGLPGNGASHYAGGDLNVYARTLALGVRENQYTTNSYGGLAGATIQLPKDWQMDTTGNVSYIKSENHGVSGYSRICSTGYPDPISGLCPAGGGTTGIADIVSSGIYNPLAANGAQGNVATTAYAPSELTDTLLTTVEVKASGDLLETNAGPIGLAVGATASYNDYHDNSDLQTVNGNVLGGGGGSGAGHRTSEAVYSEFSVPVVAKTLELQIAGRYDHFSDFGSTFNPKIGFLYHANRDLLVRGSVGTGFRAPLLTELYAGPSQSAPTFTDYAGCAAHPGVNYYCAAKQYTVNGFSNPNLKQETSIAYNLGTIYEPTKEWSFGVDLFYTKIENVPGIDYDDMERYEAAHGLNSTSIYGVQVIRAKDGSIDHVNAPTLNLAQTQESGVDVSVAYTINKWKIGTDQNQLVFYKTSGFPGVPVRDKLGWAGQPAWRNTTSVNYAVNDRNNLTLYIRSIPSQLNEAQNGHITPLTTFDLAYALKTPSWGDFTITLINLLNSDPPIDGTNTTNPLQYGLYDLNGRQLVVGYKKNL